MRMDQHVALRVWFLLGHTPHTMYGSGAVLSSLYIAQSYVKYDLDDRGIIYYSIFIHCF